MGDHAKLLGHGEAALFQARLRHGDLDVQGVREVGAGEGNGQGKMEAGTVQLVDGNDGEWAGLCLLASACRFGISPVDLALLGSRLYHSGVGASKASSSLLSAR